MNKETFIYLDVNDATFEWHNNTWMQVADNA